MAPSRKIFEFERGAGRQLGVLITSNSSIYETRLALLDLALLESLSLRRAYPRLEQPLPADAGISPDTL